MVLGQELGGRGSKGIHGKVTGGWTENPGVWGGSDWRPHKTLVGTTKGPRGSLCILQMW